MFTESSLASRVVIAFGQLTTLSLMRKITGTTPVIDYDLPYTGITAICEGEKVNYSIITSPIPNDLSAIQWINKNNPSTVLGSSTVLLSN